MEENLIILAYNIAIMLRFFDVVFPLLVRGWATGGHDLDQKDNMSIFEELLGITKNNLGLTNSAPK